ncbi:MAG TPA: PDZ domain-containing protein [Vicinamibacterales bacterium]|nr:PDZ domain-containing protein [Vicinamibacterales bacterium]
MKGWVVASTVAGAVALGPVVYGQTLFKWKSVDAPEWAEQAVRIFGGSGGRIGVSVRDLSDEDVKAGKTAGVLVEEVEAESPAEKAGIKAGDVVVEFDGDRVRSSRQFTRLVQESAPGRTVSAAVLRAGQRVTVNVQPREWSSHESFGKMDDMMAIRPTPKVAPVPPPPAFSMDMLPKIEVLGASGRLGITVEDLSPQLAEYFGTKDGVLVKSVNENSVASKSGLKAGDVITSLDGGTVNTAADLRRRTQRLESGDEFTLGVVRDKKSLTLKGKLEPQARKPVRTIL